MSIRILVLTLACLALAAPAGAGPTLLGAKLDFPVPASDIGNTQLGVGAGVSLTRMQTAHIGAGLDVIYHYWPASAGYEAEFDRFLRSTRYEALDGTWAFTAIQVTYHMKFVTQAGRHCSPWVQVGAGAYRLNRNLDERRSADTYTWVTGPVLHNVSIVPGYYGSVGVDVHACSPVQLGLDATYHYVQSRDKSWTGANDLPNFSAFTVGAHVLFGRE